MTINLHTISDRLVFMKQYGEGIFKGHNVDSDPVIVIIDKNNGMIVKTRHSEKPKWWECVEYDSDGWQESVSYEPVEED